MNIMAQNMELNKARLTALDAAIGDADHGINMCRGFAAVRTQILSMTTPDLGALFKMVGMTLVSQIGGAAGPLYGGFFLEMSKAAAGKNKLTKGDLAAVLRKGMEDMQRRGKAEIGDKTILDALFPAVVALQQVLPADLGRASCRAAEEAKLGAEGTRPLLARKGRASYLGERSIGHQDPGATSCSLLFASLAVVCEQH
jgi:phosphoenolpyruvate---glycerone phosphotransferase subunit DhaL